MKHTSLLFAAIPALLVACGGSGGGKSNSSDTTSSSSTITSSSSINSSDASLSSSSIATSSAQSNSSSATTAFTQTGYLLDSALANVDYQTATRSGVTGTKGEFYYEPEEEVSFSIGDMPLGQVTGQAIVTPLTLTNNSKDSQAVRNMARLLQTLDKDSNPANGITITNSAKSAAVSLDWNSNSTSFESATLGLISNGGQDQLPNALIDEEQALDHLQETLTQIDSCPGERRYQLQGTDVVVQSLIEASDEIELSPITGTLTLSEEVLENNIGTGERTCIMAATEGYNFDSNSCLVFSGSLTFLQSPPAVSGTIARNSATLFFAHGGVGSEYGQEVVDAYFFAQAETPCAIEPVASGTYELNGVEYVFVAAQGEEEAAWEAYIVSAEMTLSDDQCTVTSSEGDWSCKVVGNNFYGLGEAHAITGTITNNSLTYVIKYNTNDGESFYGYAHGARR
ncbi:hypothetical protein [Cellvibrio sp. NN19]|uniref:hypothetical protein n=1 Tax=Cellvibrio chitinivorans TaxID=3102792 RepID=UPI002B414099|nr:hypothetical protein [Cellvibrio sp. NN19]